MKFDFAIGNPPYQDNTIGDNKGFAPPVYNLFMEAAYSVADKVEMIHPARFLFNAGSTPKAWNEKMLKDKHFKVLRYESDCTKIFANTDIKGGVAISYRDGNKDFGAIGIFTPYEELNCILKRIMTIKDQKFVSEIAISGYSYHFTEKMHSENPTAAQFQSAGHRNDLKSNIIEKLSFIFFDEKPDDENEYVRIVGRANNERVIKFIKREYINTVSNLDAYKIFLPKASGIGAFGEVLGPAIIAEPKMGHTETFFSIGCFATKLEAENALKYLKTKFARCMLSVLKKTQNVTPGNFSYVPIQDFTENSDIDWSKSIPEIDKQLYEKYGLSEEEIAFIETNVKEME